MIEMIASRTLPSTAFPELVFRHKKQLKDEHIDPLLYSRQLHEIYMYTFFKNTKLSIISEVLVDGSKAGHILGLTRLDKISVGESTNEDAFYKLLIKAPLPFLFVPKGAVGDVTNTIVGIAKFKGDGCEGLIMDIPSACSLGIAFLCNSFVGKDGISIAYIGLMFRNEQL